MIRSIDHLVITTADMDACIVFYKKLGFSAYDTGGRWELFAGNFKINVHFWGHELEPKARNVQPGSVDICFELDVPLDACIKYLAAQDVPVELGVVARHGVRGVMRSLYLRDPDENLVELCSYE